MTTVKQMIEWLQTLPEDAEVQCGVEEGDGYQSYMQMVPVDLGACEVCDYSDEQWGDNPRVYGKVFVEIRGD